VAQPETFIHETLKTAKVEVQIREHVWTEPFQGTPYCADHWFLDLSLTERPGMAQGHYADHWNGRRQEPIGDVLFVPHTLEFHGSCGVGRQTSLSMFLSRDVFELQADDLDEAKLAEGLHIRDPHVRQALWRLAAEMRVRRIGSPARIESQALAVADMVERHLAGVAPDGAPKRGGLSPARRRLIEARIRADAPTPGIGELAALCGLSERHLARAFREETGQSLGGYVAVATLQRAWRMLLHTGASISEIAADLGYFSSASFAAAFRRSTGARPNDVRRAGGWAHA